MFLSYILYLIFLSYIFIDKLTYFSNRLIIKNNKILNL